jgi:hypothetical protein
VRRRRRGTDPNKSYTSWDVEHQKVDSVEVRKSMTDLNDTLMDVLQERVANGDFSLDVSLLDYQFDQLRAAAKHRFELNL